MIIEKTTDSSN